MKSRKTDLSQTAQLAGRQFGGSKDRLTDRRMTSVLDSHGLFKEASERDDAGLKARAQLRLRIPAGLHEV